GTAAGAGSTMSFEHASEHLPERLLRPILRILKRGSRTFLRAAAGPAGQVLSAHASRSAATDGGSRRVGSHVHGHRPGDEADMTAPPSQTHSNVVGTPSVRSRRTHRRRPPARWIISRARTACSAGNPLEDA